jgi:hypothetical protein
MFPAKMEQMQKPEKIHQETISLFHSYLSRPLFLFFTAEPTLFPQRNCHKIELEKSEAMAQSNKKL